MFPHNMSSLDRRIRAAAGTGLVLCAAARRRPLSIFGGLVGAVLLFTVATDSCPIYRMTGISTARSN